MFMKAGFVMRTEGALRGTGSGRGCASVIALRELDELASAFTMRDANGVGFTTAGPPRDARISSGIVEEPPASADTASMKGLI